MIYSTSVVSVYIYSLLMYNLALWRTRQSFVSGSITKFCQTIQSFRNVMIIFHNFILHLFREKKHLKIRK